MRARGGSGSAARPQSANRRTRALTVVELAVSLSLLAGLVLLGFSVTAHVRRRAAIAASVTQIHGLVAANTSHAADHNGEFSPAMSADNLTRWHGGRDSTSSRFDPARGFLSPYLGKSERILSCPLFRDFQVDSFEAGAGAYGYNAEYYGSTREDRFRGASVLHIEHLGRSVMFATTALAAGGGVQEYPFTEPFFWVDKKGQPRGQLQPTTHFRANGKAIIAWGDGHVTLEEPCGRSGPNFFSGDNEAHGIGWFGPDELNGFWNPSSPAAAGGARGRPSEGRQLTR